MNPNLWTFTTTKCAWTGTGEEQRWQAHLNLKNSVGYQAIAVDVARELNMNPYTVAGVYRFTDKAIINRLQQGSTVNFELFGFRVGVTGSLPYSDSPFDSDSNSLRVSAYAKPPLRDCLSGVSPRNTKQGLSASIVSIMDSAAQIEGMITVPTRVLVGGKNIMMGDNADEWCALLSKAGEIVARPTVLANTGSTLDLDFGELPPDGDYVFVVRARNHASTDFAPASARIAVSIRRDV